jgi:hypothetical protein
MLSSPANNKRENGAQGAQASYLVESQGSITGRYKESTVPKAAHASIWFGLRLDSGDRMFNWLRTVSV